MGSPGGSLKDPGINHVGAARGAWGEPGEGRPSHLLVAHGCEDQDAPAPSGSGSCGLAPGPLGPGVRRPRAGLQSSSLRTAL